MDKDTQDRTIITKPTRGRVNDSNIKNQKLLVELKGKCNATCFIHTKSTSASNTVY